MARKENLMEKKKMGRPKKNLFPRDEKLTLKLSKEELSELQYCSELTGLSRTDVIVKGIQLVKKELKK